MISARTTIIIPALNLKFEKTGMTASSLESLAFWTGVLTVGCTAFAALSGCFARWFTSQVRALKKETQIHFDVESATAAAETVALLEWSANWAGRSTVGFTAAAAFFGCFSWWFSSTVSEMQKEANSRFERESDLKIEAAKQGTAKALAESATAKENTGKLEIEAARLREQASVAESKIKAAEARVAEANERSVKASEGTAKALAEAATAKEHTSKLEVEAARLLEQAAIAEAKIKGTEAQAAEANERSAKAGEGTAKALAEAAAAKERTGKLEVEAARLREMAARAEQELIEVQERIKPRHLIASQRARLLEALKPIPKVSVSITVNLGDGEAHAFAKQLQRIFQDAGWADVHVKHAIMSQIAGSFEIHFRMTDRVPTFIILLASAFDSVGVETTGVNDQTVGDGEVKIVLGMKSDSK